MIVTKAYSGTIPFPELRGSLERISWPAMGEIKYDGEFGRIGKTLNGETLVVSKSGSARSQWVLAESIAAKLPSNALFLCEIMYGDGKRGELYNLLSNKKNELKLNIKVFDVDDCVKPPSSYLERSALLLELVPFENIVTKKVLDNRIDAATWSKEVLALGYEGIVIKNFDSQLIYGPCSWVKIKPRDTNNYEIAYIDPIKERIEIKVTSANGAKNVGCKVGMKIKSTLKVGQVVTIEHQGILVTGGLRHPVFKGVA